MSSEIKIDWLENKNKELLMNICDHVIRSIVELQDGRTQINNNLNNRAHARLRFIMSGLRDFVNPLCSHDCLGTLATVIYKLYKELSPLYFEFVLTNALSAQLPCLGGLFLKK